MPLAFLNKNITAPVLPFTNYTCNLQRSFTFDDALSPRRKAIHSICLSNANDALEPHPRQRSLITESVSDNYGTFRSTFTSRRNYASPHSHAQCCDRLFFLRKTSRLSRLDLVGDSQYEIHHHDEARRDMLDSSSSLTCIIRIKAHACQPSQCCPQKLRCGYHAFFILGVVYADHPLAKLRSSIERLYSLLRLWLCITPSKCSYLTRNEVIIIQ